MSQELDLVIGSISYFTKPVGRGCAWFHVACSNSKDNNFILMVDEDIDLRVLNRLKAVANALVGTPYKIAMAGERKGSITILLEPDLCSDFSENYVSHKKEIIDIMENGVTNIDQDFWGARLFLPSFDEKTTINPEFLSAIAHPALHEDVYWFLMNKKEEEQDRITAMLGGHKNA